MRFHNVAEIKAAFDRELSRKVALFAETIPKPIFPEAAQIGKQLKNSAHECFVDIRALSRLSVEALEGGAIDLFDIVLPDCVAIFRSSSKARELAIAAYRKSALYSMDYFVDRVFLDQENAFLMLQDFRKWEPATSSPK